MQSMIDYQLKRYSRSKSIRIRVLADESVLVTAPLSTRKSRIDTFVVDSMTWILERQAAMRRKLHQDPLWSIEGQTISYLGKTYSYVFDKQREVVKIENNRLVVSPITALTSDLEVTLYQWMKRQAKHLIEEMVREWSLRMEVNYSKVRYGQQTSRWGSCSTSGTLSFNWRLIHFSEDVIQYVVIHELAHLIHQNHEPAFWRLVARYCPHFASSRLFLRRQQLVPLYF